MYCVGLTGTIASGKSTVAAYFAKLGIEVISADHIARQLTAYDQPAFAQMVNYFGTSILTPNHELDRRQLRDIIFNDKNKREWLEQLLHPLIREQIAEKTQACRSAYCVVEIPLLIDRTPYPYLNRVILVLSTRKHQIERLMKRDNSSEEQAAAILASQASETTYRALADDVIINDNSLELLHDQVIQLHKQYLQCIGRDNTL